MYTFSSLNPVSVLPFDPFFFSSYHSNSQVDVIFRQSTAHPGSCEKGRWLIASFEGGWYAWEKKFKVVFPPFLFSSPPTPLNVPLPLIPLFCILRAPSARIRLPILHRYGSSIFIYLFHFFIPIYFSRGEESSNLIQFYSSLSLSSLVFFPLFIPFPLPFTTRFLSLLPNSSSHQISTCSSTSICTTRDSNFLFWHFLLHRLRVAWTTCTLRVLSQSSIET